MSQVDMGGAVERYVRFQHNHLVRLTCRWNGSDWIPKWWASLGASFVAIISIGLVVTAFQAFI